MGHSNAAKKSDQCYYTVFKGRERKRHYFNSPESAAQHVILHLAQSKQGTVVNVVWKHRPHVTAFKAAVNIFGHLVIYDFPRRESEHIPGICELPETVFADGDDDA